LTGFLFPVSGFLFVIFPVLRWRWQPAGRPCDNPAMPAVAPFPTRVNIELTNHCNQRCPLCPRREFTRPLGFMSRTVYERVVSECAQHPTKLWLHFLGEPLLHKDVLGMIRFAKAAGVGVVGLSTNGVSLHGKLAAGLLESGLDRLECSIDADDREAYLAMRGRDHFNRVRENVRAFLERKRWLGKDRPITSLQFMRTPAVEAVLPRLVAAWQPWLGPHDFVMTIVPASFAGAIDVPIPAAGARPPCPWLFTSLMVLQDGTVTMCGADWDAHASVGNVCETSLGDIWHGDELARRRRAHREGQFSAVAICGGCEDWRLADGRGYANASLEVAQSAAQG
jgi:MoaA/NifB/PqqE/SkfB family radical SAM enzyme